MLLTTFAVLFALGVGLWVLGTTFEYTGIAAIGAVLVIAVGGTVVLTDLTVRAGSTVEKSHTVIDNETVVSNVTRSPTTERVSLLTSFGGPAGQISLGGLLMTVGGLLLIQSLNEVAFK